MMNRLPSSVSPTPIKEGSVKQATTNSSNEGSNNMNMSSGMGNNFAPTGSNSMIASQTTNTAPAPSNLDSNLMDLLRRSQKAMPNVAAAGGNSNNNVMMMNFASAQQQQQNQGPNMQQMNFGISSNSNANNSLDYSTALAAAVATGRNPSMFQGQGNLGQGNDAMFLLQQQQAQQRARLNAVDGGNSFLQERLGMSNNMNGLQQNASIMNSTNLSSPTLQGFSPNNPPMDLAQVFMASQQQGNSAFASGTNASSSSFGPVPNAPYSQNVSDLSRMIMMLRGQGGFGTGLGGTGGADNTTSIPTSFSNSAFAPLKSPEVEKKRPPTASLPKKKRTTKKLKLQKPPKTITVCTEVKITPRDMPCVLYTEDDDDYLTPYQCLLRKQLELFVADPEDVRCSSQQGRTTNIKVGQVGLRCRHCEGGLASRTKGAVYYSHSVDGIYQVGQNIGKVHLAERCYRIPDDIRRQLIALRNDSRRASSGKAYWSDRVRALGVYEEGKILKLMTAAETEAAGKKEEKDATAGEGKTAEESTNKQEAQSKAPSMESVSRQE